MMKAFFIMEIIEVQNVHSIFDIQTSKSKIGDFQSGSKIKCNTYSFLPKDINFYRIDFWSIF